MLNHYSFFVRRTAMLAALFITGLTLGWFLQTVHAQSSTGGTGERNDEIIRLQAQISAVDTHVTNLETININFHQQIAYLQNADQGLQEQVNNLKIPNRNLQEQADNLQKQVASLEASNRDLQEQVSNFRHQVADLNSLRGYMSNLQSLYGEVHNVASQLSSLQSEVSNLRSSVNSSQRR